MRGIGKDRRRIGEDGKRKRRMEGEKEMDGEYIYAAKNKALSYFVCLLYSKGLIKVSKRQLMKKKKIVNQYGH